MKLTALTLATLLGIGSLALAQGPGPGPGGEGPGPRGPAPGGGRPMAGNLFAPEMIMRHAEEISLTDEQRQAIRSEMDKAQDQFQDMQRKVRDEMEKMEDLMKPERVDENAVRAQLDKVLAAESEIKKAQLTLMIRIKNQLTGQQQGQLKEIQRNMMQQPRGPRPGGPPEGDQGFQRGQRPGGPAPEGGRGLQRGPRPQGPPPPEQ